MSQAATTRARAPEAPASDPYLDADPWQSPLLRAAAGADPAFCAAYRAYVDAKAAWLAHPRDGARPAVQAAWESTIPPWDAAAAAAARTLVGAHLLGGLAPLARLRTQESYNLAEISLTGAIAQELRHLETTYSARLR